MNSSQEKAYYFMKLFTDCSHVILNPYIDLCWVKDFLHDLMLY